ncbi:MAG: DNA mismatch repair endonuclease MutL [Limisphaerales bacterium]
MTAPVPAVNRIRLLPDQVANQIAAGEVVERPASVLKELVENALDAGAARIEAEIQAAGRGLLRVGDDGCGMSRDDALLCLERHATSKIAAAADLARVTTMGFRGEAIPSIASVSRFTLTTRESAAEAATRIVIHGGKILEVTEAGAPSGTTVEVRGLFFNVPARRKFLRSDETERAHLQHWLTTAALAHPDVAFTLTMEGREAFRLPALPAGDPAARLAALRERLRLLLGEGLPLLPVDATGELEAARIAPAAGQDDAEVSPPAPLRVWGWVGAPGISRATRADQHLFVNRRPVENRGLNAALLEGFQHALMKGRYPLACLFLELDPAEVDVNIHPAKREVKFHRERAVRRVVADAVRQALAAFHRGAAEKSPVTSHKSQAGSQQTEDAGSSAPVPRRPDLHPSPLTPPQPNLPALTPPQPELLTVPAPPPPPFTIHHSPFSPPPASILHPPSSPVPLLAVPLRLIGVVGRLYVVLESDRGLVLMDQHAAHERVLFEQMLRRVGGGGAAPSQRLLLPETVEVSPRDAAFLRENLAALARVGVGLREFGERTFLLEGLPPFVRVADARRFALGLVDELRAAVAGVNAWRLGEDVVAKTVCRHAVKANDPLARPELEALLADLRRCAMPYTCPHGRPTLIEMNFRELEKKFGRIQG